MNEKFVMPWEERPADCKEVMWRYSKNPVIGRFFAIKADWYIAEAPE